MIDDHYRPRFLIVEEAVVVKETRETHIKHVVRWWNMRFYLAKVLRTVRMR